ncbi:MAG: aspartate carbamoyltransferase catalytic subunit, partial [Notoacmeibacter sp.]
MSNLSSFPPFPGRHLLGIKGLSPVDVAGLLDRAD